MKNCSRIRQNHKRRYYGIKLREQGIYHEVTIRFYITPEEYDIAEKNGICRDTLEYRIRKAKFYGREVALTKPPRKASGEWKK